MNKTCPCLCRKDPSGEPSQLQIIVCAKNSAAVPSRLAKAGSSLQQASYSESNPLLAPCDNNAQAALNAELQALTNRHTGTSLATLPTSSQPVASSATEGLLARSAKQSMVNDGSKCAAADTQLEQHTSNLPDEVAALVKQHHLKLHLVQVANQVPLIAPAPPPPRPGAVIIPPIMTNSALSHPARIGCWQTRAPLRSTWPSSCPCQSSDSKTHNLQSI